MDVGYFLRDRIAFIRQFFESASLPFSVKKRKIEAGEDQFIPPYSEDGEPPFLDDWLEADESYQVVGYSCISMLAAAFHLYLKSWETVLGVPVGDTFRTEFKIGWFNGYKAYFAARFGVNFEKAPSDLKILEEIVLARNRIQHPDNIVSLRTNYLPSDLKKIPHVFFVSEAERGLFSDFDETEKSWLFSPSVHITEEKLMAAIIEIEKFSGWLEGEIASFGHGN